jgi:C-terminal processing protease CtpA/Prc
MFGTVLMAGCTEEEPVLTDRYVNDWIYENMQFWYYWNDELPANPVRGTDPETFFYSLLSEDDRFSWIQDDFEELLASLQGVTKEAGYAFKLYRRNNGSDDVVAQIVYIKPDSPAEDGLIRGDVITRINGQTLTLSTYEALIDEISENHSITIERFNPDNEAFEDAGTFELTTLDYSENPNYLHTTFDITGHKIGYYVYNLFAPGPSSGSTTYDQEMDNIFSSFKTAGITDLVVDLRFNSGGAESSTVNLASLIAPNVDATDVFVRREYNPLVELAIINEPELGEEFLTSEFKAKSQNVGTQISGKVYILTSSRSASASELLINGLKPFMEVFLIGDTTFGKNYGSITLTDEQNRANKWGMQPIVVRSYNSLDQSEYSNGFYPDIVDLDNSLVLAPLGDVNERLLNIALEHITGGPVGGRKKVLPGRESITLPHQSNMSQHSAFEWEHLENTKALRPILRRKEAH